MILISSCRCLCPIHWNQGLNWEWRCSWSSADRRCSNHIWVINDYIAYRGETYIRVSMVDGKGSCGKITCRSLYYIQCQNFGKKLQVWHTSKSLLSFTVISDVRLGSLVPNKTTFTKYCLTQWIRDHFVNAPGQLEMTLHGNVISHWVGAYTKTSLVDFKTPGDPLNKAIPCKFHGSDGHSKHNCLHDQANFHRSHAWQSSPCPSFLI